MRKTKLKPYVHKTIGAKNCGLYDLLNGQFYTITPDGDVDTLKRSLREAGLTFETGGTVPLKIELDLKEEIYSMNLREVQVRLNGRPEDSCLQRQKLSGQKEVMTDAILNLLIQELEQIQFKKIRLEAESNTLGPIISILENGSFTEVEIVLQEKHPLDSLEIYQEICNRKKIALTITDKLFRNPRERIIDVYKFFYHHYFNPCLGQKIAIDCGGEIKPCLWSHQVLGKIGENSLRELILSKVFDDYWLLSKDKIKICRVCEYRYVCDDCRITVDNSFDGKPFFCTYDPITGT